MSESEAPLFNPDSEPEEEALGLKEPLGIIQRFIVPLGANALTVLDPSIFLRDASPEDSFGSLVQGSPRFEESAPIVRGRFQLGQDQLLTLSENPSAESQSVEKSLKDSESETIQAQQIETSEIEQPTEIVQGRSPSTDQRTTPSVSQNIPNKNVNLQRSPITSSEENQTQSPVTLEDLGFDASAQTNVGDRKELDIAQTSTEKEVDRDNAEMIERSQASDPATSSNIDQPIQQQALQPFPEVNPTHPNPIVQAQTYESKIIDAPLEPPVSSGDPSQNPVAPPSSSLNSPRLAPLGVNPNLPILGVAASDQANEAIEATDFRAPIVDPTIQQSRSGSVVQGEVSASKSTKSMSKEPCVPSELSSSPQRIEVGESTPDISVMRSPLLQETSDAIAPQVTPHTETNLEATLLQPRLIDSASVESESSILPESPKITSLEIEPPTLLPSDLQADTKSINAQKSAEVKASSKANPKSLLSKTIQFLSKAAASIVATPKKQPSSEAITQIQSSPVQTDSIQQFEERPSQSLQIQEEPTLSSSPMIAESNFIQPGTRSQETLIEQPAQTETRSPDAKTPIQQSTRIETRSPETPIQQSLQSENQSLESNFQIQRFVQADERSPDTETLIQTKIQSTETPIQHPVEIDARSSEIDSLIQRAIQAEGQIQELDPLNEQSIQVEARSTETSIQQFIQADALFLEEATPTQQSIQVETLSSETPIEQSIQPEIQSQKVESIEQVIEFETRPPEASIHPSDLVEERSPETEPFIKKSVTTETRASEIPVQRSVYDETRPPELDPTIQHFIQVDARSPEAETQIQSSVPAKEQTPVTETPIQRSLQLEEQLPEAEKPIQSSVQTEKRSPEKPIETSFQTDAESPEADPVIQKFTQDDTRSPETEAPIQPSVQTEIQSTETPTQKLIEIGMRSLEIETPIQRPIQLEEQKQEVEPLSEKSIQVKVRSTEISIQRSVRADALFSEEATATQQSVQAEMLASETQIEQSIQPEVRSPKVESSIEQAIQVETGSPEAETPILQPVQVEAQTLEDDSEIQRSEQLDTRSSETPIQASVQTEGRSPETFIEQSVQSEIQSLDTPIQASAQAEEPTPETPIQQSVRSEGRLPEPLIEQSVPTEMRSPDAAISIQQPVQAEDQLLEAETLVQRSIQAETRSNDTETPIETFIQTEMRSPEVETFSEQSAQAEVRSPEAETPFQRSIQPEIQPPEVTTQKFVQSKNLLSDTETALQRSAQPETQSSETSIEQVVRSEMGNLDTSIQPEERSAEIPIQQSIQAETQSPEAEPSIQEIVHIEGRSPTTDSPAQRVVQPPTHETIQTPQCPSPLSQAEHKGSSESIASDIEKVQPISPSELAIARETTSGLLSETAITPYSEFPQLPTVLKNLSILKPLAQNTVQKIPEQSHTSSYPSTVEGKQTQSPPKLGSHFLGRVVRLEGSGADLGGQCRVLATPQASVQEPIAANSTITVQKSSTQYTKIDIPPRKTKTAEVRSQSTPSIAIAPKTTIQTKRQNPSNIIQMAQNQTLISEGKEEIPLETDTSISDIAQDLETLAQTIYAQLQQRLRIDRERHGYGTGRFPW